MAGKEFEKQIPRGLKSARDDKDKGLNGRTEEAAEKVEISEMLEKLSRLNSIGAFVGVSEAFWVIPNTEFLSFSAACEVVP